MLNWAHLSLCRSSLCQLRVMCVLVHPPMSSTVTVTRGSTNVSNLLMLRLNSGSVYLR